MIARAQAGVEVRVVLDAIGSSLSAEQRSATAARRTAASVAFYQPITWYRLHRLNNRTHRELLVVDGRIAFTGGAGVADWWYKPRAWPDVARHDGAHRRTGRGGDAGHVRRELARSLRRDPDRAAPLAGDRSRQARRERCWSRARPSDRATASRVVFQMLIEGAVTSIDISTPYFLPDRAFRRALVRAAQRGVQVRVIVPGPHTDQRWVRLASRRMYRELLEGGVRIFEYRPSMTHVKA